MNIKNRRRALCAALMTGALFAHAPVGAQGAWPNKPIRWIVPYTAGGGTDIVSRMLGERLSEVLGTSVVVDNRPGGNTLIGAQAAANATPDGYTVFFTTLPTVGMVPHMYARMPYAPDALTPVTQLVRFPLFLMAGPDGTLDTPAKFAEAAKKQQLQYAIGGTGTPTHLGTEMLARQMGVTMQAIPFRSMGQAGPEVAAGRVAFMFGDLPATLPHVQAGRGKIIATASKTRSPLYPDAPTLREAGLADLDFDTWAGLTVPKGTPQAIVDRLSTELNKILAEPAMRAKLIAKGVEPAGSSPEEFRALFVTESARWGPLVKSLGIKPD